jgi:A/G-specific adenine glycosylase
MRAASYEHALVASPEAPDGVRMPDYRRLQEVILAWYSNHRRDLPWRRTRDPYRILVSEIMLQQTQVDRVIPKYEEFLEQFPTIASLAAASLSKVLRVWSPLGYNRRARYLYLAARAAADRFQSAVPRSLADLRTLPGLGRYTAGAVACFAFEQHTPVVDTNIRRVLGRVIHGERDGVSESVIWKTAEAALPEGNAYSWNQALMDLGATVCSSEAPQCGACPAAELCRWRARAAASGESLRRLREPRSEYRSQPDPGALRRRWRGRIINALRAIEHDDYVDWPTIVLSLPPGHEGVGVDLEALLWSLVDDGLAVAEEREGEIRARLPS